jgi:hypothetical protein
MMSPNVKRSHAGPTTFECNCDVRPALAGAICSAVSRNYSNRPDTVGLYGNHVRRLNREEALVRCATVVATKLPLKRICRLSVANESAMVGLAFAKHDRDEHQDRPADTNEETESESHNESFHKAERKGEARRVDDVSREAEPRALPGVASTALLVPAPSIHLIWVMLPLQVVGCVIPSATLGPPPGK